MTTKRSQNSFSVDSLRLCALAAGAFAFTVGVCVLLGWMLDVSFLKSVLPGKATMKPNTALCFVFSGVALVLVIVATGRQGIVNTARKRVALICSALVAIVGIATLIQYLFALNLKIDSLVFPNALLADAGNSYGGRMAATTALGFSCFGVALLLRDVRPRIGRLLSEFFSLATLLTGLVALIGFAYGVDSLYYFYAYRSMAVHTALLFFILGLGSLFSRPQRGLIAVITSDHNGGLMARRAMPVAVLLPFLIGWFTIEGEGAELYGFTFGLALFATSNITIFVVLLWFGARSLNRIDTRRRSAGEQLRASEERFRQLADVMPQVVWTARPDGWLDYYNQRWFDYTGLTLEQTEGSGWGQVLHPDDLQHSIDIWNDSVRTGAPYEIEYRFKRASDGDYRWHLGRASAVRDEEGRIVKWFGTGTDIDDQKRAEAALATSRDQLETRVEERTAELVEVNLGLEEHIAERRLAAETLKQSEAKFKEIFDDAPVAYHELDQDGRITRINRTELQMLGYTTEELVGRPIWDLVLEQGSREAVKQKLTGTVRRETYQRTFIRKDGTLVPVQVEDRLIYDLEGCVTGIRTTLHDMTLQKQMDAELREARDAAIESGRLKSEFLANMSHEIRTPMNGVIGMTGLLLDSDLNEEQRDCANTIRASGEALLTIINDILDLSKIEAGKLQFDLVDFDLRNAVEGTVELLAERAREKNIEFASFVHSDVPLALRGDPGRLRQVLTNLAGNALKFTETGEVILSAEKELESDSRVTIRFSVKDTGIGISEDTQQRLFQAFTQADGSTTRKYGGTGLGLSISKQLVELMGGNIGVTSAPEKGSTFWFTASFEKQRVDAIQPLPHIEGFEKLRVLVVGDKATNRKILSHQLNSWGMVYSEAESGARALQLLKAGATEDVAYDLAIIDLAMPGMDGLMLAEAIKSDTDISRVRLVLMTAFGERGDGARSRNVGISAYLSKPVRQSQLFDCLISVMSKADAEQPTNHTSAAVVTKHSLLEGKKMSHKLILLAEDNVVNQKVAVRQLQKLGYRADAVSNGREAIEALNRIPYDLVFMDCQMPEMDGYEAATEIRRQQGRIKLTPIVAMMAHALAGDRQKCIAAGMDDYITKPVKLEELSRVLDAFLAEPQTEQVARETNASPGAPVDVKRMHEAMGDTPEEYTEILHLYLKTMSNNLGHLDEALKCGNQDRVELLAHNSAGTSANCGMIAVIDSLRELERAGREGQLENAPRLLGQVKRDFARIQTFIESHVNEFDMQAVTV